MSKYQFGSIVDRDFRLELQRMADYISEMGYTYEESLQKAHEILDEAKKTNDMNESVQQQINALIAESGTSDAELIQARIDAEGNEYTVLKERLDESDNKREGNKKNIESTKNTLSASQSMFSEVYEDGIRSLSFSNLIWSWWIYPLALYKNGVTYVGGVRNNGEVSLRSYNHRNRDSKNYTLYEGSVDDHNAPSIAALDDGKIAVFYCAHNQDTLVRYRITDESGDITTLGTEQTVDVFGNVTYAQNHVDKQGRVHLFVRSSSGQAWRYLRSDDNCETWEINREIFRFGGQMYIKIKHNESSWSDGSLRIALTGHPQNTDIQDIYYCYMDLVTGNIISGGTKGNAYDNNNLPLTQNDLQVAYDSSLTGLKSRLFDVSDEPTPSITFADFTDNSDGVYKYAKYIDGEWIVNELAPTGSVIGAGDRQYFGGLFQPPNNQGEVLMAREGDGVWYIERWKTTSNGKDWAKMALHVNRIDKSFRPIAPLNAEDEVMFPSGTYNSTTFTIFNTNVQHNYSRYKELDLGDEIKRSGEVLRIDITSGVMSADLLVKFDRPFKSGVVPDVFVTVHKGQYTATPISITNTQFAIRIHRTHGDYTVAEEVPVRWMAIGES